MSENTGNDGARLTAARDYVGRGWAVLALYGLDSQGNCMCQRGADCPPKTRGKHPIGERGRKWTEKSMATLPELDMMPPHANVGILTGLKSGIWALDVDPDHDGDKRLAELEAAHGVLPTTFRVRTGSGGEHYYFRLPDDFTPTNTPGRLPPGLDVRGEGGQVVAAPSVSGRGAYQVIMDAPLCDAPGWLLELIKPLPVTEREPEPYAPPIERPLGQGTDPRLAAYVGRVLSSERTRLAQAQPGARGSTAFQVACNLIELSNSPWAAAPLALVHGIYWEAAREAQEWGGEFDDREAADAWASATRKVGTRGRPFPAPPGGGEYLGWEALGGAPPFSGNGSGAWSPMTGPSMSPGAPPTFASSVLDPFSDPLAAAVGQSLGISQTTGNVDQSSNGTPRELRTLSSADLDSIPPPQWLVDDFVTVDSLAYFIGKPGEGKSFVALDMALCIATGKPWQGRQTRRGRVLLVVGEGMHGIRARVRAWEITYNDGAAVPAEWFRIVSAAEEQLRTLNAEAWGALIRLVGQWRPGFIVLDTQARLTVGVEENSNKDMGLVIAAFDYLRQVAGGACVGVVHHQGHGGVQARGASSIKGAADSEITISKSGRLIHVKITKQKDAETEGLAVALHLDSVPIPGMPGAPAQTAADDPFEVPATPWTGGVLRLATAAEAVSEDSPEALTAECTKLIGVIRSLGRQGGTKAEIKAAADERLKMSKSTFYRSWNELLEKRVIASVMIDDVKTGKFTLKSLADTSIAPE